MGGVAHPRTGPRAAARHTAAQGHRRRRGRRDRRQPVRRADRTRWRHGAAAARQCRHGVAGRRSPRPVRRRPLGAGTGRGDIRAGGQPAECQPGPGWCQAAHRGQRSGSARRYRRCWRWTCWERPGHRSIGLPEADAMSALAHGTVDAVCLHGRNVAGMVLRSGAMSGAPPALLVRQPWMRPACDNATRASPETPHAIELLAGASWRCGTRPRAGRDRGGIANWTWPWCCRN